MSPPRPSGGASTCTRYAYRAMRPDGVVETGHVEAATESAARALLGHDGFFPMELRQERRSIAGDDVLPAADLALGFRLLSSLLGSGLSLEPALKVFVHVAPPRWTSRKLTSLRAAVREGRALGSALTAAGIALPPHVSGMLDAAEVAGRLSEALRDAADLMRRTAEHRAEIRGALAYPAILAAAGSAATALLVGIVLPRFSDLLADVGLRLPASAALLLAAGRLVKAWWIPALVLTALITGWSAVRFSTDLAFRRRLHGMLLELPWVGSLRKAAAGARVASSLAGMLGTGVPIAAALLHASRSAGDEAVSDRMSHARESVIRGERLSRAVESAGAVRPGVVQLIRAGEASGELVEMLRTAARIEEQWELARLRTATRMLEPMLILVFGAVIAFIAAALLQAVYSMRPLP